MTWHVRGRCQRRLCLAAIAGLVAVAASAAFAGVAAAAPLRPLASGVSAFASDDVRYVAWQVQGTPIVVLDTRTGRRIRAGAGCMLEDRRRASAGRFLLSCGTGQDLLDASSGMLTPLPQRLYGPTWEAVGLSYVDGQGTYGTSCLNGKHREECTALYDIATGATSMVAEANLPEIDKPGAPPVCRALRSTLLRLHRGEIPAEYGYGGGVLVRWLQHGEANVTQLQLTGCRGRTRVLGSPTLPGDIEVGGGLVTWDTGRGSSGMNPRGEYASREEEAFEHSSGHLISYEQATGRRRSWMLPRRPLKFQGEPSPIGVWGYSAHTRQDGFWAGAERGVCGRTGCSATTYVLYATRL